MFDLFAHHHHHNDSPWAEAPHWAIELAAIGLAILERMNTTATQAQLDKLAADVSALIDAGVAEITAAVAAAQTASNDPAIDALDTKVTAATKTLQDAAASLKLPPAAPAA